MVCVLSIVIISIAAQIVLTIVSESKAAGVINVVTFGALSTFFLLFGIHNRRKGRVLHSTGGFVCAAIWAVYTVFLIVGGM